MFHTEGRGGIQRIVSAENSRSGVPVSLFVKRTSFAGGRGETEGRPLRSQPSKRVYLKRQSNAIEKRLSRLPSFGPYLAKKKKEGENRSARRQPPRGERLDGGGIDLACARKTNFGPAGRGIKVSTAKRGSSGHKRSILRTRIVALALTLGEKSRRHPCGKPCFWKLRLPGKHFGSPGMGLGL